ncbi:hypothetical protein, partial [Sandarakinorhabdus sp.]|uniref:hypothetical protein n=1 Tax=Sandarakinorhabdus sp. TaxID=1916663 RepID=UPI00333F50D9
MHKSSLFTAAASAALVIAALSAPAQSQLQNAQPSASFLDRLFGNIFGNTDQAAEQTLEANWNQGYRPFEQRRGQFETRIDAAVRDGTLSRVDANDMRGDYEDIVQLEAQYSANGPMQPSERNELRSRYRSLMQGVGYQNGGQNGG